MRYSELRRKLETTQLRMTDCLGDLASVPDHELAELVWENGQVVMQGQSNKTRKSSPGTAFTSHVYKAQEKDDGDDVPKFERIGSNGDSVLNDFSSSGQMGLGQDDELVRWLNYSIDDYCSEFFSEFSGISQNTPSVQNNAVLIDKRNNHGEMVMDSCRASTHGIVNSEQGNASKVSGEPHDISRRYGKLCPSQSQQCQTSLPSHKSRVTELNGSSAHQRHYDDRSQNLTSTSGMPNDNLHKQGSDPNSSGQQPSNNAGFMNFSHFLRPATLVKSNQQSAGAATTPEPLIMDRSRSNNKVSTLSRSNPIESSVIDSNSVSRSITGFQTQPVSFQGKVDVKSSTHKPSKELLSMNQSEAICPEDAFSKGKSPDQALGRASSFAASMAIGRPDGEKGVEAVVASSSVCSGNSTGAASNDPKLMRKSRHTEESEYPSEDVEEESVGVRKPTSGRGGKGAKRSRAAEVHNLSERRRRDRINEKMRALQELIPNCNKVDKASMLDEAIEYLKTLQLQVQIMAMRTGLYMPPMMLPPGMQHMHAPNMAPFSPMNVGMGGMGMGFGMGMLNVSGSPSGCPLIQMPPMNGSHFPCPHSSGLSNLPIMAGSNHSMFGFPVQGNPMSMPSAPFVPFSGGPPSSALLPSVAGVANPLEVPSSAGPSCSKDRIEDTNTQFLRTGVECSQNHMSIEGQATKKGPEQSSMDHKRDKNPKASGNEVLTPPCRG